MVLIEAENKINLKLRDDGLADRELEHKKQLTMQMMVPSSNGQLIMKVVLRDDGQLERLDGLYKTFSELDLLEI